VCRLGQSIHNNPHCVKFLPSLWEPNNEIHGNTIPLPFWNLKSLKKITRPLMPILHLLTAQTPRHILYYIFLHSSPPIILTQILIHLGNTWMNGISQSVSLLKDRLMKPINIGNTYPALHPQHPIIYNKNLLSIAVLHCVLKGKQIGVVILTRSNALIQRRPKNHTSKCHAPNSGCATGAQPR